MSGPRVLMVPGWTGSGPGHWQSLWQGARPEFARVEQANWDDPHPDAWDDALARAIAAAGAPLVLVGHSLGCVCIARWAAAHGAGPVCGALLVAPCDVDAPGVAPELARFAPMPLASLPFPTHVVVSDDDPFVSSRRAFAFAARWGASLELLEGAGHIVTDTGHGEWPDGLATLDALVSAWSGAST